MKKLLVCFVMVVLVFSVGVFANPKDVKKEIEDFVKERGIVGNITEIDFGDLPDEVDIEKVENTSIVIFQVDYNESKPLFVITSSDFREEESVVVCDMRSLLSFGFGSEMGSGFLNIANGVQGGLEKGYVMMRSGSVTGISTNLEVLNSEEGGRVEIVIYKNGEEVGFRNVLSADVSSVVIDYDVLSKGVVGFEAGDVISVYVNVDNGVFVGDVVTMVEVSD